MGQVSVVIPVGPGHVGVAREAVASVKAQTYADVECVVVNDSGQDLDAEPGIILSSNKRNVAYARNIGIQAATGEWFVCLDADDLLHEEYVEHTLRVALDAKWVYTDCFMEMTEGISKRHAARDWNVETLWRSGICFVTCLYPKTAWQKVGGFDETIGHEDWEFHLRLANGGFAGVHLKEPLVTYRRWLGQRSSQQATGKSKAMIQNRYPLSKLLPDKRTGSNDEWPVLIYTGKSEREFIITGRELSYKIDKRRNVVSIHPNDVPYVIGVGLFRFAEKDELQQIDKKNLLHDLSLSNAL